MVRRSVWLGHHCRCMMPAHVQKSAQDMIITPDDHNRFAGDLAGNVGARLFQLIGAGDKLPRLGKDGLRLEGKNALVDIPRGRNRCGLVQWQGWIVAIDYFFEGIHWRGYRFSSTFELGSKHRL